MDLGLNGRTAAVAGGSAGLGFATAQALANDGVRVVVCGRDEKRAADAAAKIGKSCVGISCDVSSVAGGESFVEQATKILGQIDILILNSGGPPPGTFASTSVESYDQAFANGLMSMIAMTKLVVPQMQSRKWGRVIAITSIAVRQPIANLILSNTARAGLTGFLKTVSREVAGDGVTVNTVQPGTHDTDRIRQLYGATPDAKALDIPAGFVGDPKDFGSVVAFLCSESAKFITGVNLQVDGGAYTGLI
ncbi:MAG: SDR family oxidoreductase [Ilumatobacteraceae bacterium]|jgi:3-oxoacyl-[acyl-carrier protein] reductase|nr:SDR family oxidoreductase [Actinomycetota bacterium]MDP4634648.1 SDR family oxidoreductase [Ilumatobacteraceae bacterium]